MAADTNNGAGERVKLSGTATLAAGFAFVDAIGYVVEDRILVTAKDTNQALTSDLCAGFLADGQFFIAAQDPTDVRQIHWAVIGRPT